MKKTKLLIILLTTAMISGFYSCKDKWQDIEPREEVIHESQEQKYKKHIKNYESIKFNSWNDCNNGTILFLGLRNECISLSLIDKINDKLISNWEDTEKIDTIIYRYSGYGEYETEKLREIRLFKYYPNDLGFICKISYYYNNRYSGNLYNALVFCRKNKKIEMIKLPKNNVNLSWYKESYFIENCCYSYAGDTLYTVNFDKYKVTYISDYEEAIIRYRECIFNRISIDEGIGATVNNEDTFYNFIVGKINYREGERKFLETIKLPFKYEDNAKTSYTLIDNSTDIWKYKVSIIYFDGTKDSYNVSIDINIGKVIN